MRARTLVWAAPIASGLLLAAAGAAGVLVPAASASLVGEVLPNVVLGLVLPLLGAAVLTQVPRHPLGRLWIATGLAGALTLAVFTYAQLAVVVHPGALPLGVAAAWLSSWLWVLGAPPLLTLGLLIFPDGRLPSRRWAPLLVVAAGAVVLPVLGQALAPGPLERTEVDNPLGVPALDQACAVARALGFLCFTVGTAGGAASLVVRWWRGTAVERGQLALPGVAAGLLGGTFLVPTTEPLIPYLDAVLVLELTVLLVAFGVAVLRDRVTGADVVLRRSLTYGLLTGALCLAYAAAVTALAGALPGRGAELLATVGAALLVLPLRDRLQALVDRAVYGDRHDPLTALARLGDRLDAAAEPDAVLDTVAEVIAACLRLPCAQVVVDHDGQDVVAGQAGVPDGQTLVRLPLNAHGETVGALLVAPRAGQDVLSARDLVVLEALRRQAGPAVAAVRLAAELQASRERIVAGREEERRRLRRDLHDGLGPTLAGIGLGLEVARTSSDLQECRTLLGELAAEAATAVFDVRRLVEDLRPPALDEFGLIGAIQQHVDRLSLRHSAAVSLHAPQGALELPAAVEVAAYRIALEALTNALRHGAPNHCALTLRLDEALHVEVTDDGTGMPAQPVMGMGLAAMRERAAELGGTCTVQPARPGTTVLARLPLDRRE